MFCSSLRKRKEWAQLIPALSRSTSPGWKETSLQNHDVAFALPPPRQHHQPRVSFRLILLSSEEASTAEVKAKIERLSMLNGGQKVAIMLLLDGSGRVDALVHLQMSILTQGMAHVPIIPVSSIAELVTRLDALRRQCTASVPRQTHAQEMAEVRALASHCVHGQPLSRERVNILTDISSGLGGLAQLVFSAEGRRKLCDLLDDKEGNRVVAFFVHGHESALRLEMRMREQAAQASGYVQKGLADYDFAVYR